jgi:osmotically-inducible protein OsmY
VQLLCPEAMKVEENKGELLHLHRNKSAHDAEFRRSLPGSAGGIISHCSVCSVLIWHAIGLTERSQDGGVMAAASLSEVDTRVRDTVMRQLEWDPAVDAGAIGVAARDRTVTLTGYVDTYVGKLAAERAAKRVRGVRAVANDIEVRPKLERTDADIALDVVRSLELRSTVPANVQAAVHQAHVTLTGEAMWEFQRRDAEKAVRHVRGVRGVVNRIALAPMTAARDARHRIVEAFHRNADLDARQITAHTDGAVVTLSGRVGTWLQREIAERAAGDAPGIRRVDNRIIVEPPADEDEIC